MATENYLCRFNPCNCFFQSLQSFQSCLSVVDSNVTSLDRLLFTNMIILDTKKVLIHYRLISGWLSTIAPYWSVSSRINALFRQETSDTSILDSCQSRNKIRSVIEANYILFFFSKTFIFLLCLK